MILNKIDINQIDFMRWRKPCVLISLLLIVIGLTFVSWRGLDLGLDFSGGALVEVRLSKPVDNATVRAAFTNAGLEKFVLQSLGQQNELIITLAQNDDARVADRATAVLQQLDPDMEIMKVDFVGAQVGSELAEQGVIGALVALALVLAYVAFRFQIKFAAAAIVALFHDVIITVGLFAVARIEFDLSVLAALLALIGYSLNDTIVVFDRIRENLRFASYADDTLLCVNNSIRQVFTRTIHTSSTTLLVLLALLIFGGSAIFDFALALIIGVLVGTYSSIYVASSLLLAMRVKRDDVLVDTGSKKELDVV